MTPLAPHLTAFFSDYMRRQRQVSRLTEETYAEAFCLLFRFAEEKFGRSPSDLFIDDLDAPFIGAFLDHLETVRKNSPSTRNARLAAVRSFFRFLAYRLPELTEHIRRVLAIPQKRLDRDLVDFLTREETEALLAAPDLSTRMGRRDHALLFLAVRTGLRVSEISNLRVDQIVLTGLAHVRCRGKGRKERTTPLSGQTVAVLRQWLRERAGATGDVVFPSRLGGPMSSDAVQRLVRKHATAAAQKCPTLREKRVTPHVLRHTTAVALLQAKVDRATIALWLGHESVATTQIYLDADLAMKEAALAKLEPLETGHRRYRPSDPLLAFLQAI